MTTVAVDLPAHNAWVEYPGASPGATQIGDHEALADGDESTGFSLSATTSGVYVGATESSHPGYAGSSGTALGFGLFDLPAGATLVDVRFVAHMDVSSVGPVPAGSYGSGVLNPPGVRYPTLAIDYAGAPTTLGYGLDAPASGTGQVEVVSAPIQHLINGSDYVIAGIGSPDTGTFGLCPKLTIADPWWQYPREDHPIFVSYLALRITYTTPGAAPPCQLYPRDDDQGAGTAAVWPPPSSGMPGGYY